MIVLLPPLHYPSIILPQILLPPHFIWRGDDAEIQYIAELYMYIVNSCGEISII